MKTIALSLFLIFQLHITAQTGQKVVLRMPITESIVDSNDSVQIVQIKLPLFSNITIEEKTLGVLQKSFVNEKDNLDSIIGVGRCYLIKGNFYYFGIKLKGTIKALPNDIISFSATIPNCYTGLLYQMSRFSIAFQTVEEKEFYNIETPFLLTQKEEEEKYLNHMVKDIQYTGTEMLKQMPDANKEITEGLFKGKKIFTVMQNTTVSELKEFLKYVQARPKKYAAQTWKISEIYATWADSGAPQVTED